MARPFYAALLALALLGGCSNGPEPTAPSSGGAAQGNTGTPADDPPGTLTCKSLANAVRSATLMNPGVVDGIVRLSSTADAPLADAAKRLAAAYAAAVNAHGTDAEPDAIAGVSVAGAEMTKVCDDSGLAAVG